MHYKVFGIVVAVFLAASFQVIIAQSFSSLDSLVSTAVSLPDSAKPGRYLDIGSLYNRMSMPDSAYYFQLKAQEYARSLHDSQNELRANQQMAVTNIRQHKFEEALTRLFQIVSHAEKQGDLASLSDARSNIGYIYQSLNRFAEAIDNFKQAEKLKIKQKDSLGLITVYSYQTAAYGETGDTAAAIKCIQQGFVLCDMVKKNPFLSAANRELITGKELALFYSAINNLKRNEDLEKLAPRLELFGNEVNGIHNQFQQLQLLMLRTTFAYKRKQYTETKKLAETVIAAYRNETMDYGILRDVYSMLAEASAGLGDFRTAYIALDSFRVFNDSLFSISQEEAIHSVQARYETAKREQEIIVLSKQQKAQRIMIAVAAIGLIIAICLLIILNRAKKLQKKVLENEKSVQRGELEKKMFELEQTALRAQINPHFIFNSLNSVQSFIINHDAKGANNYLSVFASLIRQTLDNSGKPVISLADELQYLDTYLHLEQIRGNNYFQYSINVEDGIDPQDIFIPNMLIQPYVENCIQHAFPSSSQTQNRIALHISLKDKLVVELEDNGAGIGNIIPLQEGEGNDHVPRGSSITEKRIGLYNTLHDEKIEYSIGNLSQSGGTRVVFKFPL